MLGNQRVQKVEGTTAQQRFSAGNPQPARAGLEFTVAKPVASGQCQLFGLRGWLGALQKVHTVDDGSCLRLNPADWQGGYFL
jgi:hypothetical protein